MYSPRWFGDFMRVVSAVVVSSVAANSLAQDVPQFPGPEPEHEFLKKFVGEWEAVSECSMGPDQPTATSRGTMKARMLGGLWVIAESETSMMDHKIQAILTIGYDPARKKYVGTWVDSMINHLWHYEGTVAGETITLSAEGPNFFAAGKTSMFQDIYEFKSANEVAITSRMQTDDGSWVTFMTGSAKRRGKGQK